MRKNKLKRAIALLMVCMMVCGMTIVANATVHECAFSYTGIDEYSVTHISYHDYTDGKGITHTCEVTLHRYREVWHCACGASEYRNYTNVVKHSGACGQ